MAIMATPQNPNTDPFLQGLEAAVNIGAHESVQGELGARQELAARQLIRTETVQSALEEQLAIEQATLGMRVDARKVAEFLVERGDEPDHIIRTFVRQHDETPLHKVRSTVRTIWQGSTGAEYKHKKVNLWYLVSNQYDPSDPKKGGKVPGVHDYNDPAAEYRRKSRLRMPDPKFAMDSEGNIYKLRIDKKRGPGNPTIHQGLLVKPVDRGRSRGYHNTVGGPLFEAVPASAKDLLPELDNWQENLLKFVQSRARIGQA